MAQYKAHFTVPQLYLIKQRCSLPFYSVHPMDDLLGNKVSGLPSRFVEYGSSGSSAI